MFKRAHLPRLIFLCLFFLSILVWVIPTTHAENATSTPAAADPLQLQIAQSSAQIEQLKKEIATLQKSLNETSQQKQTLQNAVKTLDLNIRKITTSITLTNTQITQKDNEIKVLTHTISTTTNEIGDVRQEVGGSLASLHERDSEPLMLTFLAGKTLSDFFDDATALASVRIALEARISRLLDLKTYLVSTKTVAEQKRSELAALKNNLSQQKESLAIARDTQTQLLKATKNQESTYQAQIAQKKAQEAKFEQDLLNYEAALNLKVSKGSLPSAGSAPLMWPVDQPVITQYFGNTPFSTANPQVYNGHGHNAVDLKALPGTPIKAARRGVVLGTGNTDATCPGASYGKWIFIEHDDGLSTIYAHLSVISVVKGQEVEGGQLIGYSDTTGYATGPHLHFGVYASSGSEIASFPSKSCAGKTYTMPVADVSAYLNPLSYLPPLR